MPRDSISFANLSTIRSDVSSAKVPFKLEPTPTSLPLLLKLMLLLPRLLLLLLPCF